MNPLVAAHSAYVRSARHSKSQLILGYLTDWTASAQPMSTLINERCLTGMHKRAAELGYRVDQFQLPKPGVSERRLSRILSARSIMGIVVSNPAKADNALDLDWQNVASVAIGHELRSPPLHRVFHDQYGSMRMLLSELTTLGYKRIGLAMENRHDERTNNLISAAYLAHQSQQRNAPIPPLLPVEWTKDVFMKWYHRHKPDAVVSALDDVVRWLRNDRVPVPEKVGFASICVLKPKSSGIHQHFEAIGAAAVNLLVSQLHTNQRGVPKHPQAIQILGSWQPGATVRKA